MRNGRIYVPTIGFPMWSVNYSSTPNVLANRLGMFAKRHIKTGEELTIIAYEDAE